MADIAPSNRKRGRPLGSTKQKPGFQRTPARAGSLSVERRKQSLNTPPPPPIGIGNVSSVDDAVVLGVPPEAFGADVPPMSQEATPAPIVTSFGGKYGLLKTNIVMSYAGIGAMLGGPASRDGVLFMASAESIADAWIAWGKADPRYMRIVNLLWGSPFMTLMVAHAPLIGGVMANHGISMGRLLVPVNMRRLGEVAALRKSMNLGAQSGQGPAPDSSDAAPAPLPYEPVGPFAPTEATPPPDAPDEGLRILPDDGLPSEIDVQLREISRKQGIPYQELRDQAMLQMAQMRMQQNGKVASQAPALGVPVMKPE